jgi:ABC-2 type transport system ATP-binding protein
MAEAAIYTEALTRRYGARRGIEDVSLNVPQGALYGFLGPNGAGKTTTIRVLLGLMRPTSGTARVLGLDAWKKSRDVKAQLGYIPGDLRLYPWLNGKTAVSLFGRIRGIDMTAKAKELAEMFDLDLSVKVRRMSRGMRQKLGLVLSLAPAPRLLILDEPTSALDPLMQDRLQDYLQLVASKGTTVFFSSHTLGEVERLCERVAIVREGKIVADDTLDALKRKAGHEVEVQWAGDGSRGVDVLPGLVLSTRSDVVWRGMYHGEIGALTAWLGGKQVEDVMIRRPDLETLFRKYYVSGE